MNRFAAAILALAMVPLAACGGPPPSQSAAGPAGEPSRSTPHGAPVGDAREHGGKPAIGPAPSGDKSPAATLPTGPRIGAFGHLWTAETKDWNGALLLTQDGDVLSFSVSGIRVHAREDGRVLHQANACTPVTEDGAAFVGDDRIVVVCDEEIRSFSWPKLGSKKLVSLSERVDEAAIAGGVVAVAENGFFAKDKKGKVHVYDARDGRVLDEFVPPAEVEMLALASDGSKLMVGTREAGVLVRDLRAKTNTTWSDRRNGSGASFSPDGKSLFGDFASFEASAVEIASGKVLRKWPAGSWLTASRWIDATTIAATGSEGLALYGAADPPTKSPIDDLGEGIALSRDGGTLCAGGRSGRIACFARTKPAPTTLAGAFSGPGTPRTNGSPGSDPAQPSSPELDAKLIGRKGKILELSVDPAAVIEVGSTGPLSKPFESNLGFVIKGWIVIAQVKVVKADKGKLTLEIVEEKSAMTVNGRTVNHFTPGPAKLALSPPP